MVIGPESTGKSTLSNALARELKTVWVDEYARHYLQKIQNHYTENDLLEIAKGQLTSEDKWMQKANKYMICDTDLYVVKVWSEHAFGKCHRWILEQIAVRKYDYYILTDIDMPWEPDPLREHGALHWRNYFLNQYKDIVMNSGVPWAFVRGTHTERLQKALHHIKTFFSF